MELRRAAIQDARVVLAWRNDPHTRAMSRDDRAVEEGAHLAWFERALADPRCLMLIGALGDAPAGMVRFDGRRGGWEVSINVAPEARGQGVGKALLEGGLAAFASAFPGTEVQAVVRTDNAASIRLFEAAGFSRCGEEGGLLRYRWSAP